MTDEQINQRIAEACGWVPDCDGGICWDQYGSPLITPPNYCNDLNSMHDAEKHIPQDIWNVYINKLARVTGAEESTDRIFLCATARQRAEAFLKTMLKWEEVQK